MVRKIRRWIKCRVFKIHRKNIYTGICSVCKRNVREEI